MSLDVRVGVKRCFSTTIPYQLRTVLEARTQLIKATESGNRNLKSKMEYRLRTLPKIVKISESDIIQQITELISKDTFGKYVYTEEPFKISKISQEEDRISLIPEFMNVNVFTDLNYNNKIAKGNLAFKREEYKKEIQKEMDNLIKKKK